MKIIKKILSISISALGVLILSGFLSLRPIGGLQDAPGAAGSDPAFAHHDPAHACNDVSGVTSGVPSPQGSGRNRGVEDSGRLDFNADPPAQSYQTCAERGQVGGGFADGLAARGEDVWFLKGWTWNTNLGYISFYCDGGQNFGGDCSDQANPIDYETYLDSSGQVNGWAWGDNIGWISMTCRNGDNVGQNCGRDVGSSYSGVRVAQDPAAETAEARRLNCNIDERGDFYGYAWSDSVGWLNFCGAHVDLESPLVPEVTLVPDPTEDIPVDGGDAGPDGIPGTGDEGAGANACDGVVYANGSDSCKIVVQIKEGGSVLTRADLESRGINVEDDLNVTSLTWNNAGQTTLRADQVTLCGEGHPTACTYNGALLPLPANFAWSDADNGIMANVRAIAPTSATDQIILESLAVQIDDAPAIELTRGDVFSFLPAVQITRISSISADSGEEVVDQISAVRGTSEAVYLTAAKHDGDAVPDDNSLISIFTQLYDCDSPYEFLFDEGEVGVSRDDTTSELSETHDLGEEADRENIERAATVCPAGGSLADINTTNLAEFLSNAAATITRLIFSDVEAGASPTEITDADALGIRMRVEYLATVGALTPQVQYFSRLVRDGSLINQAADVRGNVWIDVQKIIREGAIAQSLKNDPKDTQFKREKFYRAIKNIINTKGLAAIPGVASGAFNFTNITSLENGLRYFNTTNVPGAAPCKIILDDAATLNFENNVTLVGEGCDFFIDQNIMADAANPGRLGIIALEDLSLAGPRRGGNIYICHRVTDLEANIVADGSLFAYGANETDCGADKETLINEEGLPTPIGTRTSARRQLTIIGSLVSNNTYGGAFESPPLLGDGTLITDPAQINKVRLYDINFLRYAHTRPITTEEVDAFGLDESFICWDNSPDQLSKTFGASPNCFNNNPGDPSVPGSGNGIVNIIYRAPAKDMKIFGAVR